MTSAPIASHYADQALFERVAVLENEQLARDTYRVRLQSPRIAARSLPGQFFMVRFPDCNDPLLGRPLALYDTAPGPDGSAAALDLVYLVVGKGTSRLADCRAADQIEIWGPLGNGFAPQETSHLIMVAGGIGQTPFLALAREHRGARQYGDPPRAVKPVEKITLCYGVRRKEYLAGVDDFQRLGVEVDICTDDGSAGRRGFVTEAFEEALTTSPAPRVVCCGPEPMMQRVAERSARGGVPCQVSLETPMACGIGICFSCVAKVRDETGGWDYRRTCVEGPVFDGAAIEW